MTVVKNVKRKHGLIIRSHVNAPYCYEMGVVLRPFISRSKNTKETLKRETLFRSTILGSSTHEAQASLSMCEAIKWYKCAAKAGYVVAQHKLVFCYENGVGVDVDIHESNKWGALSLVKR